MTVFTCTVMLYWQAGPARRRPGIKATFADY